MADLCPALYMFCVTWLGSTFKGARDTTLQDVRKQSIAQGECVHSVGNSVSDRNLRLSTQVSRAHHGLIDDFLRMRRELGSRQERRSAAKAGGYRLQVSGK